MAIRYAFEGDLEDIDRPVLDELEARLLLAAAAPSAAGRSDRQAGQALLSLKEIEYLGAPRDRQSLRAGRAIDRRICSSGSKPTGKQRHVGRA